MAILDAEGNTALDCFIVEVAEPALDKIHPGWLNSQGENQHQVVTLNRIENDVITRCEAPQLREQIRTLPPHTGLLR
jgi:hypothetical protein